MTSLQVCHCTVIFYIPTKFHDDRNLSYMYFAILMMSSWRKVSGHMFRWSLINECAKFKGDRINTNSQSGS